jgi:vacuolar-type H+-ATPase catalytic subunit A/Vma1
MTINNIRKIIPESFLSRNLKDIYDSGEYCGFCGLKKNKFRNTVLLCDCERNFNMLRKFIECNNDWLINSGSLPNDVIRYKGTDKERHLKFVVSAKMTFESMRDKKSETESRIQQSNNR